MPFVRAKTFGYSVNALDDVDASLHHVGVLSLKETAEELRCLFLF